MKITRFWRVFYYLNIFFICVINIVVMEELSTIIATNLVFLRKKSGLTQLEFGEKFNYTDKTVSRWESGTSMPSVDVLKEIADFYGISVDYILTEHHSSKEFNSVIAKTANPKNKIVLMALYVTVIWAICATIYVASIYNTGTSDLEANRWWCTFLWAVPISFLLLGILNHKWFRGSKWTVVFFSAFVWTILIAAFITFIYGVFWYLFFIGVPVQVAIILASKL